MSRITCFRRPTAFVGADERKEFEQTSSARFDVACAGVIFTGPPLKKPAVGFGIGTGGAAHAPNEWYLIDSKDPKKIAGLDEATMFYVDYLYELAETAKAAR